MTRITRAPNRPRNEVGFRVALRRLPNPDGAPLPDPGTWTHTFEGPGAEYELNSWQPFTGNLTDPVVLAADQGEVRLEDGCLVLQARAGNDSAQSGVVHRLSPSSSLRVTLRARLEWDAEGAAGRGFELALSDGASARIELKVTSDGLLQVSARNAKREWSEQTESGALDPSEWRSYELILRADGLEARGWIDQQMGPDPLTLTCSGPILHAPATQLDLRAHNYIGVTARFDELRVEPLNQENVNR